MGPNLEKFINAIESRDLEKDWRKAQRDMCGKCGGFTTYEDDPIGPVLEELSLKIEHEDSHGGEGQGDEYWGVFSISRTDGVENKEYYRISGYYTSYSGSTVDTGSFERVYPKKVEVIQWST